MNLERLFNLVSILETILELHLFATGMTSKRKYFDKCEKDASNVESH